MPTELELIALETEFDLYLSFTKRLVLNLPDSDDRTRAAIWLQKLRGITNDDQKKLRNEHLKLLLFALHRRSMLSVFEKPPPEELESFHDGLTLLEMTRELIELTEKKHAGGDSTGECPLPPVSTNVSADLKEYCASQSIPKFGAHVYYAVSNEPIQMWSKSPNCVYPAISDVPNPLQWELTLSKLTDHVLEKQAEAERLAAEAAHDDKTEEKDNTQVLPMIDVAVCNAPGSNRFKWKPDSILTLHQNYDFSDVGVAEDLEVQGKWQLELDEMAFSILDHSLPGRQRVVVRDPYYKGLPPDIAERRNHGVIDEVEVESSSSSSGLESSAGERGSKTETSNSPPSQTGTNTKQSGCCRKSSSNIATFSYTATSDNLGPLANKYLTSNKDFKFGIHYGQEGQIMVGPCPAAVDGDDILVDFGDGEMARYKATEGVWRLLTQDQSYFNEETYYSDTDWVLFMEILIRANEDLKKEIEEQNPEQLNTCAGIALFSSEGWGWTSWIPELSWTKFKEWAKEKLFSIPIPTLGLSWPEFKLGVPNLGLSMDMLPTIPGLEYLKFWKWFQTTEALYLKELDDNLKRFISLKMSDDEENKKLRADVAVAILERVVAIIGQPGGWATIILWCLINQPLLKFAAFSSYVLNDMNYELHIPGTDFCGPGTQLYERLAQGQMGQHPTDQLCMKHDLFYRLHPDGNERMKADIRLGLMAMLRLVSLDASIMERFAGILIVPGMTLKVLVEYCITFMADYLGIDVKELNEEVQLE
ncbi:uncharacterized protein LOC111054155 isoform X5 [Nilaparvata lugens]|uniref:uncharacterized protein LOC111054155 isoform X5 n=1 Tax=Nilaparvata lugens TaxID=108931 RepID=UPI00193E26BC|nr:uncharacterized protein LOC111054155 isoform X5 [Nilaparvata lugens]